MIEWLPCERERKRAAPTAMPPRVDVASPCSHDRQPSHYRRRFPPELEQLQVCTPCPSTTLPINAFILTTYGHPRRNYGLAIPAFKCAKELRDRIKLVRTLSSSPSAYPQTAHNHSPSVFAGRIASGKAELLTALIEYETSSVHFTTPTMNYWTSTNSTPT